MGKKYSFVNQDTTTDATPKVMRTIAIPQNKNFQALCLCSGSNADGTVTASGQFYLYGFRQTGNITNGRDDTFYTESEAGLAIVITGTGATSVTLTVTGKAATTMVWVSHIEITIAD